MSKAEQKEAARQRLVDEKRHQRANIPMELPADSYEVVPGIYVASAKSLPRLIEFFNVRTIVRVQERPPGEDPAEVLVDLGGTPAQPYGTVIDKRNVFHAPLRDSLDEREFPVWAGKAAEFIAHALHTEESEETENAIAAAQAAAKQQEQEEDDQEEQEQHAENNESADKKKQKDEDDDGGEAAAGCCSGCGASTGGAAAAAAAAQSDAQADEEARRERIQREQNAAAAADTGVDPFDAFRVRSAGAIAIHCQAGRSRSPAVAIAYLILKRQMSLQEALEMFDGDNNNDHDDEDGGEAGSAAAGAGAGGAYKLQINPVFIAQLALMEAQMNGGQPVFDLRGYWVSRLAELFPKMPKSTIASQLEANKMDVEATRTQLMGMAARQHFDRDALMLDALFDICGKTADDYRAGSNMRWTSKEPVVSKAEVAAAYRDSGKKRDVALFALTKLIKERMMAAYAAAKDASEEEAANRNNNASAAAASGDENK